MVVVVEFYADVIVERVVVVLFTLLLQLVEVMDFMQLWLLGEW